MDWLMNIFTGGTAAALGSVFGGLFALGKGWMEQRHQLKVMELQAQERIAERGHELAIMDKEADRAIRISNIEADKEISLGDLRALTASIEGEIKGATWSAGWSDKLQGTVGRIAGGLIAFGLGLVDIVRGLFRPAAACFLMGATFRMYLDLAARVGALGTMTPEQAFQIYMQIVGMLLFLTGTAVGWYFGARPTTAIGRGRAPA